MKRATRNRATLDFPLDTEERRDILDSEKRLKAEVKRKDAALRLAALELDRLRDGADPTPVEVEVAAALRPAKRGAK